MKKLSGLLVLLLFTTAVHAQSPGTKQDSTTIILVRHAEKTDDGSSNPPLSEQGMRRALALSDTLAEFEIAAIYSTPYKRTKMTATPIAEQSELEIVEYGLSDPKALLTQIVTEYAGKAVLIVGHSNTTPYFVNLLIGEQKYQQLKEDAYGDIFVVKTTRVGKGQSRHSTY